MDQEQLQKARRRLHRRSHGSQGTPHGPRRRHRGRRQRHRRRQAGSPEGSRHRGGQDARPDGRRPGGSHEKQGNVSPHLHTPNQILKRLLFRRRFFLEGHGINPMMLIGPGYKKTDIFQVSKQEKLSSNAQKHSYYVFSILQIHLYNNYNKYHY